MAPVAGVDDDSDQIVLDEERVVEANDQQPGYGGGDAIMKG